jgi:hypothetical protein
VPGLILRIALRTSALQVDGHPKQSVSSPLRHGGDEFAGVAIGVPRFGIRVDPAAAGLGVQVVERCLDHAAVEQQPLDHVALPPPALIRRRAIDVKRVPRDRHYRPARCTLSGQIQHAEERQENQQADCSRTQTHGDRHLTSGMESADYSGEAYRGSDSPVEPGVYQSLPPDGQGLEAMVQRRHVPGYTRAELAHRSANSVRLPDLYSARSNTGGVPCRPVFRSPCGLTSDRHQNKKWPYQNFTPIPTEKVPLGGQR